MADNNSELNEEDVMKISILDQQTKELESNLSVIDDNLSDLIKIKESIESLSSKKAGTVLSQLGKGVFIETNLNEKKDLFVEVGAGIVVKKTSRETTDIIDVQLLRLQEARMQTLSQLELYGQAIQKVILEMREK